MPRTPKQKEWFKPERTIVVLLTCKHTVKVGMQPWRPASTFSCEHNTGCGYALGWIRWDDSKTGKSGVNPKYVN